MPNEWLPPYRVIGNPNTTILSSVGYYLNVTIPRVAQTANLFRAGGRLAGPVGAALLGWDMASITIDTFDCYRERQP
jgi:hypothetical protein